MRKSRLLVLLSLLSVLSFGCSARCDVERYVSPTNGTNNMGCLNSSDPINNPCQNLSFALIGKEIEGAQPDYCNISTGPDNLCVYLYDGIHYLSGETQVTNATNVLITAMPPGGAVVRCRSFPNHVPDHWDDIVFFCSRNITVSDLVFEHCGPFGSGMYAYRVAGLHVRNCIFRNITGVGIQTRETTGVSIRDCTFIDNHNKIPSHHRVDANDSTSADELNQLGIPSGGISIYSNETLSVEVENCTFVNNSGNINLPYVQRPVQLKSGGHGGAIYVRLPIANLSNVSILNSKFHANFAEINGGAILFSLSGARNNIFNISNCIFTNNSVLVTSGGALTIELSNGTENNVFIVDNCSFNDNRAVGGGALSIVAYDYGDGNDGVEESADQIVLQKCSFKGNLALREGSALGLFSFYHSGQFPHEVEVTDCTFSGNQVLSSEVNEAVEIQDGSPQRAAISSYRFPLHFTGINQLLDNTGGGLSTIESVVKVDGTLLVHNNTANYGGGIHLEDHSLLLLSPGSILELHNNQALVSGGGVFVSFGHGLSEYINIADTEGDNRFCFVQYRSSDGKEYPPSQWKDVSISFINNTASTAGAAFYASSVRGCTWLDTPTGNNSEITGSDSTLTIFTPPESLATPFTFSGNHLTSRRQFAGQTVQSEAMATDAVRADVNYRLTEFTVQPGELLVAELKTLDAFGNHRGTVIEVQIFRDSEIQDVTGNMLKTLTLRVPSIGGLMGGNGSVTDTNQLQPTGFLGNRPKADMAITVLRADASAVQEFNVSACHPGYFLEGDVCVCHSSHADIHHCDGFNRYIYIRDGRYAWVSEGSNELSLVSGAPPSFLQCSRKGGLPGCLFMFDQVDQQCAEGRTGFLCGSCPAGTAVSLDLQSCSDQCGVGIAVFIIMCIGVVAIFLLILAKDVQLPPELRGFIFYAQVIGLVFGPYSNIISTDIKGLRYFLNLLTFSVPLPWCVSTSLPTHGVALLGYISPILALTTLVVYTIIAKYVSAVSSRGVTHGLSLLGLFIYKYIADTSFVTVSCRTSVQGFVFLYDGTQSCTAANFLPFYLIGFGVIVLFVIPAPFVLCVLTIKRWTVFDLYHFTDELTKDMRKGRGWYAGWDVGRRLLFITLFYAGINIESSLVSVLMFLIALFVLVFHCFAKPYKEEASNVVETLILLNLVLVAAVYLEAPQGQAGSAFVVLLTILPYLYAVGFLMMVAGRKIFSKYGNDKMQQCLPEKLVSILSLPSNTSQSKQEAEAANDIPLETIRTCQDQLGTIRNVTVERLLPEESPASTVAGAETGGSDAHKTPLKQQDVTIHSDPSRQGTDEKTEQKQVKETESSADNLFNLNEDEIKRLRNSSFLHSGN